jgi:hypothetical protein
MLCTEGIEQTDTAGHKFVNLSVTQFQKVCSHGLSSRRIRLSLIVRANLVLLIPALRIQAVVANWKVSCERPSQDIEDIAKITSSRETIASPRTTEVPNVHRQGIWLLVESPFRSFGLGRLALRGRFSVIIQYVLDAPKQFIKRRLIGVQRCE